MSLVKHDIPRSVRIAEKFLSKLTTESETNGIGKPSVFLRSLVAQQVSAPEDKIEEICAIGRAVGNHGAPDRLTVRFDASGNKALQDVLDKHASGKFSVLITGILAARYDNYKLPIPGAEKAKKPRSKSVVKKAKKSSAK